MTRVLVVSASDARFMPLLRGMIGSLPSGSEAPGPGGAELGRPDLACFDLGLSAADRAWLAARGARIVVPRGHLGVADDGHTPALRSFLARPFLREYFPGYDVYVWIDSDVWLQDPATLGRYVRGAIAHGMAITHERTPAYRFQGWLFGWTAKHMLLGYGPVTAAHLLAQRHVNAGFFAVRADAPHWEAWARRYAAAIARTRALVPHDQFALNHALHGDPFRGGSGVPAVLLDPVCNWICDRGVPMWNDAAGAFCVPRPPHAVIGAVHLAGPAKRTFYTIERTGGGYFQTYLLRGACPSDPRLDEPLAAPVHEAA